MMMISMAAGWGAPGCTRARFLVRRQCKLHRQAMPHIHAEHDSQHAQAPENVVIALDQVLGEAI